MHPHAYCGLDSPSTISRQIPVLSNAGKWQKLDNFCIASTGVGWIRDSYFRWDYYYTPAHKAGLKVCVVVGNKSEALTAATNGWADAIEVLNEPNNAYAHTDGPNWQADLVVLANTIANAVHAAVPGIPVIGLGAQGSQIFNMLAMSTKIDGVVYHPYAFNAQIPETTYEWQYLDYGIWIQAIGSQTRLPKWETERVPGSYLQCCQRWN